MEEPKITCPKCGSTQITSNKKGFSGKRAVAGAVLTGGIGLLAGTIGSNKVLITCLNCGKEFRPGDSYKAQESVKTAHNFEIQKELSKKRKAEITDRLQTDPKFRKRAKTNLITFSCIFIGFGLILVLSGYYGGGILVACICIPFILKYNKVKAIARR